MIVVDVGLVCLKLIWFSLKIISIRHKIDSYNSKIYPSNPSTVKTLFMDENVIMKSNQTST